MCTTRVIGPLWMVSTALIVPACQQPGRDDAQPLHAVWEAPPRPEPPPAAAVPRTAATQPAGAMSPASVAVALVNGEPISRATLIDNLLEAHGLDMLEKLIISTALRQRAQSLGITITEADVEREHLDALKRIVAPLDPFSGLTSAPADGVSADRFDRQAAERVLEEFLVAKNIARIEFRMRMRQSAYLRKLAEREVKVDDSLLPDEYQRAYGEKVQIRCIQVGSPEKARQVVAALKEGKDFELVTRQLCENPVLAARGGLLPPFTRYDNVPRLVRDAAFALEVGQVSATIHENDNWFVIRSERRFPPSNVGIENVKDDLRARIRDRLVRERMDTLAGEVFREAAVEINDPALRDAFRKRYPATGRGASR